jgi:hypothetical protein
MSSAAAVLPNYQHEPLARRRHANEHAVSVRAVAPGAWRQGAVPNAGGQERPFVII